MSLLGPFLANLIHQYVIWAVIIFIASYLPNTYFAAVSSPKTG